MLLPTPWDLRYQCETMNLIDFVSSTADSFVAFPQGEASLL